MKKKIVGIWAMTLVVAGLMVVSTVSIPVYGNTTENNTNGGIKVVESDKVMQKLELKSAPTEIPAMHVSKALGDPEFVSEGYQLHPAFGRAGNGQYMAAYRDEDQGNIIWTYTPDDGVYYDVGGDYPSIKLWGGSRFFGTFVPDPYDYNGAIVYLFECTDPSDFETYNLVSWDWSSNGWSDILDIDIACDNSQADWEWGFVSLVASTTYGDGVVDGPFISYQTGEDGYAQISWYYVDGCAHTDADINHVTKKTYAVYDYLNEEETWDLLLRVDHFDNWNLSSHLYEITGDGNLEYPSIAVNNNDMVILAETDENGNKDIVCIYGNPMFPSKSFVTTDIGDDMYPDVRHVDGETFVCTFVRDGTLYSSVSEDGGATWDTPVKVDDNVEEEYKTADITDLGAAVMYEVTSDSDIDIWLAQLEGVSAPFVEVDSISGGFGVGATIKNTGTADATDIEWTITIDGGILGMINKEASGTISNLAVGETVTIKSGMVLGLGSVTVTVTADAAKETTSGTQMLFFTIVKK